MSKVSIITYDVATESSPKAITDVSGDGIRVDKAHFQIDIAGADSSIDVKVQQSNDGTNFKDISGVTLSGTAANDQVTADIGGRYIQLVVTENAATVGTVTLTILYK